MTREAEDALVCDFAAEYGITDWRALPIRTSAALACGLSADSRTARRLTGAKLKTDTLLLAIIADGLLSLRWMLSEDGGKGVNRPDSILSILTGDADIDNGQVLGYDSGEAWEAARRKILEGGG